MACTKSNVQIVHAQDFIIVLRPFLDMLHTSMGPRGGIKIVVTSGGISVSTSSSTRLLSNLVLVHPVCILISQVMKAQISTYGDYGLYNGVLVCSLVERALTQDILCQCEVSEKMQNLSLQVTSLLESISVKLCIDFSTVKHLIPLVRTIVSSKPGCSLLKSDIELFCMGIVKAFISTIDDVFGDVIVINSGSMEKVKVLNGILYQVNNDYSIQTLLGKFAKDSEILPVILFDIMLTCTNNAEGSRCGMNQENEDILQNTRHVLEEAVRMGVRIVACQKVVHDSFHLFLQRKGVLLMDRLGSEMTCALQILSSAKPISDLRNMSEDHIQACLGLVNSVTLVSLGSRHYIHVGKESAKVATLLVPGCSEEACAEIKVVAQQALTALRQVCCQPWVAPGAGCLETWLAAQLHSHVNSKRGTWKARGEGAALGLLQRALLFTAGISGASAQFCAVDTRYCHCWDSWAPDDSQFCRCQLVQAVQVREAGGAWEQPNCLSDQSVFSMPSPFSLQPLTPSAIHDSAIVDVFMSKCNAVKSALDACVNILNVGLIVFRS